MRAIDRLKAAVSMKATRKSVALPDGSEFEYWLSPMTMAERTKAQKVAKSDDATDMALQLLVAKAQDENGQRMFAPGDVAELRNSLPSSLVETLMLQLIGDMDLGDEEEEELDIKSPSEGSEKGRRSNA